MLCKICKNELQQLPDGSFVCQNCKKLYFKKANTTNDDYIPPIEERLSPNTVGGVTSFVCPTCGSSDFEIVNGKYKCKCCLNVYDLSDDESPFKLDLALADSFRQMADFNSAKTIYEKVIKENPNADLTSAYWGLFLCDNNVIFEVDARQEIYPSFYKVRPFTVTSNSNYQKAIELSTIFRPTKTSSLIELAERIEYARMRYFDIEKKTEPFDVFICFKNDNGESSKWARAIYNRFVRKYNVFYSEETLKDIKSTYREYESHIYHALYTSKVMLVICKSRQELDSQWVRNEWSRFSIINKRANLGKALIPIFLDGFNPYDLPDDIWHEQGLKTGMGLLADLEVHLARYINPVDTDKILRDTITKTEQERRQKDIELEKALKESQARLAELEKSIKMGNISGDAAKIQNQLKMMWIKIKDFANFDEARKIAQEVIDDYPESSEAWLGLAFIDFYAKSDLELIGNFKYYDNNNFKVAYRCATTEEKEALDALRQQYDINNEVRAKELVKGDFDYIETQLKAVDTMSLIDMRSLLDRLSTVDNKIDSFDEEYKKHLTAQKEAITNARRDLDKIMAKKIADSFDELSRNKATDLLDYEALINKADSLLPQEAKTYFIENYYPNSKTAVEGAVYTQTERFNEIIKQSDVAIIEASKLSEEIEQLTYEHKNKTQKIILNANNHYIKHIRSSWIAVSILFTLFCAFFMWDLSTLIEHHTAFVRGPLKIILMVVVGLCWLFSWSEYSRSRVSKLVVAETITLILVILKIILAVSLPSTLISLPAILSIWIGTIILSKQSPKRRHPKNATDLANLEEKKSAWNYFNRTYLSRKRKCDADFAKQTNQAFNKIKALDHDLGGIALICKVPSVQSEEMLKDCLDCYKSKLQEIKRFFILARKQAQGILTKIRRYGR